VVQVVAVVVLTQAVVVLAQLVIQVHTAQPKVFRAVMVLMVQMQAAAVVQTLLEAQQAEVLAETAEQEKPIQFQAHH
jgi:hypothetical protein